MGWTIERKVDGIVISWLHFFVEKLHIWQWIPMFTVLYDFIVKVVSGAFSRGTHKSNDLSLPYDVPLPFS